MPQKPEVFDLDMFDSHLIPTPQPFVTLFATIPPLTTLFCFPTLKTAASGQADSLSHRVIGSTLDSCVDTEAQIENMMYTPFPEVNKQLAAPARHTVFARADRTDRRQKPAWDIGASLRNCRGGFTTR